MSAASFSIGKQMKRTQTAVLLSAVLVSNSGCSWFFDSLLNNIFDQTIKDGRDLDAAGLTDRDRVARSEENTLRQWDAERSADEWKRRIERRKAIENPQPFGEEWHEFLAREQK